MKIGLILNKAFFKIDFYILLKLVTGYIIESVKKIYKGAMLDSPAIWWTVLSSGIKIPKERKNLCTNSHYVNIKNTEFSFFKSDIIYLNQIWKC